MFMAHFPQVISEWHHNFQRFNFQIFSPWVLNSPWNSDYEKQQFLENKHEIPTGWHMSPHYHGSWSFAPSLPSWNSSLPSGSSSRPYSLEYVLNYGPMIVNSFCFLSCSFNLHTQYYFRKENASIDGKKFPKCPYMRIRIALELGGTDYNMRKLKSTSKSKLIWSIWQQ